MDLPASETGPFALPEPAEVTGLYVGGAYRGLPAWSIGVFRTWLGTGRTLRDLLLDFAASEWLLREGAVTVVEVDRPSGGRLAILRHPDPAQHGGPVTAVLAVSRTASQAALLFIYTSSDFAAPADAAAQQLAEQLVLNPLEGLPSIEAPEAAGRDLAATLTEKGALPWWGRSRVRLRYEGSTRAGEQMVTAIREPVARDPTRGYRGSIHIQVLSRAWEDSLTWTMDGQAAAYQLERELFRGEGLRLTARERRAAAGEPVQRVVAIGGWPEQSSTFQPGERFICPPAEGIVESRAARAGAGPYLVETTTPLGAGSHSTLLRALAPDGNRARVLRVEDYQPFGTVLAFDDDGELRYEVSAQGRFERVE